MSSVLANAQAFGSSSNSFDIKRDVVDINQHVPHQPLPHRTNNAPLAADPNFTPDGHGIMPVMANANDTWQDSSKHPARLYRAAGNSKYRMRKGAPEGHYVTSDNAGSIIYDKRDNKSLPDPVKKSAVKTFPGRSNKAGNANDMPDWLQAQQDVGLAAPIHDLQTTKQEASEQVAANGFKGDCVIPESEAHVGRVWGKNLKSSLDAPGWLVGAQYNPNEGKQQTFAEAKQGLAAGTLSSDFMQPQPARPPSSNANRKILLPPPPPQLFASLGHSSNQHHANAMSNKQKARGSSMDMPNFLDVGNVEANRDHRDQLKLKKAIPHGTNVVDHTSLPAAGKAYREDLQPPRAMNPPQVAAELGRSKSMGAIDRAADIGSRLSIEELMGRGKKKLADRRAATKNYDLGPHMWDKTNEQYNPTPFVPPKARMTEKKTIPAHLATTTGKAAHEIRAVEGGGKAMSPDRARILHGQNPVTAPPLQLDAPPQRVADKSMATFNNNGFRNGDKTHYTGSSISLGDTPTKLQQSPDRPGRGVPPLHPTQKTNLQGAHNKPAFNTAVKNPLAGKGAGERPNVFAGDQTRSGWMGPGGSHLTDYHKVVKPVAEPPAPRIGCHYFGM